MLHCASEDKTFEITLLYLYVNQQHALVLSFKP